MTPLPTRAPVNSLWATAFIVALMVGALGSTGCKSNRPPTIQSQPPEPLVGLNDPTLREDLQALVAPPQGWNAEPIKASGKHTHQVWISPTGRTAYGVINFSLPWPVGHDLTLQGFLREMKRTEGAANLIEKEYDPNLPGLRFVAEGGLYRVRGNLFVQGWRGWVAYAGTKVNEAIDAKELEVAEQARESTRIGNKAVPGSATLPASEPSQNLN
ncbi:MAG TPA: hypothetical protein VGN72_23005 [Tepidisphaeraceae bacterium]|jgi:hypothetical protein|nr:hypothetical protein [Tepidisphaeraceae bacterium]